MFTIRRAVFSMEKIINLAEKIKYHRTKFNYTQDQFAEKLGMTRGNLSSYELGNSNPPLDTLIMMADIFKVSIDYLLGRSESPHTTYKADSEFPPEDEIILKNFLAKTEKVIRDNPNLNRDKLKQAMHMINYTFHLCQSDIE
jgi:transcriptional regulator with XRE-family HTH domain